MVARANVELLRLLPWQAFVTLTLRRLPGPMVEQRMLFAWLRRCGSECFSRRRGLAWPWVFRRELGEINGRPHFHGLIGGLPEYFIRDFVLRPRPAVGLWWEQLMGGNVRTRAVSSSGVLEYLSDSCGMDAYEMGKFQGEWVMFGSNAMAQASATVSRNAAPAQERDPAETVVKTNPPHRDNSREVPIQPGQFAEWPVVIRSDERIPATARWSGQ